MKICASSLTGISEPPDNVSRLNTGRIENHIKIKHLTHDVQCYHRNNSTKELNHGNLVLLSSEVFSEHRFNRAVLPQKSENIPDRLTQF